jgi:integrase
MAGSVPRGIRKRISSAGQPRYQVRYLVRDPNSPSGSKRPPRSPPCEKRGLSRPTGTAKPRSVADASTLGLAESVFPESGSNKAPRNARQCHPRRGAATRGIGNSASAHSSATCDEISRKDVQQFVDTLTVGPWAKLATLRLLRSILEMAREDGRIHINPVQGVSAGRIPARERHRYLTATEVAAPAACGDEGDIVTILAFTGLRWSELVGLRVRDIDLVARRLHVRQAAPEVEGRIIVGPPKTRAAVRTVPLPQIVVDALKPRIAGRAPGEHAITSPNGGFLRSNNWRRHTHWSRALKKTQLAPLTIHDLRHTYASLARASGADLRYVQKTMGHSTPTVTANIYSDLYSDELDHVATNLDRLHSSTANQANGTAETSIECCHRVRAAQSQWPGAGSNRRPSAFQADEIATDLRFICVCASYAPH